MVTEYSWYPSSFIETTWLPAATDVRVSGEMPIKALSRKTLAPAGVEETERPPVPDGVPDAIRMALTSVTVFEETTVVAEYCWYPGRVSTTVWDPVAMLLSFRDPDEGVWPIELPSRVTSAPPGLDEIYSHPVVLDDIGFNVASIVLVPPAGTVTVDFQS